MRAEMKENFSRYCFTGRNSNTLAIATAVDLGLRRSTYTLDAGRRSGWKEWFRRDGMPI